MCKKYIPPKPKLYTPKDYDNAVRLIANVFDHPNDDFEYIYHEERDVYYIGFGRLDFAAIYGHVIRTALPIVQSGIRSWI